MFQLPDLVWSYNLNGGYPWQMKLIDEVINLIMWLYLEKVGP